DVSILYKIFRLGNVWMLITGTGVMAAVWFFLPGIYPLLFGYEYEGAISLLMVLALAIPFRFLASSAGAMLVTKDNMRVKVKLMAFCAVANVVLNLMLIPLFGALGCAIATVLTEALNMIIYLLYVYKLNVFFRNHSG